MAEYAILLYAPAPGEASEPAPGGREVYDRHSEDLQKEGLMVAAFALEPATTATSIRRDVITDGPFVETKEIIAGVYVIDVPDLDADLEVARRNPILQRGGGLEVRPVAGSVVR